jgi:hypothetical protein
MILHKLDNNDENKGSKHSHRLPTEQGGLVITVYTLTQELLGSDLDHNNNYPA